MDRRQIITLASLVAVLMLLWLATGWLAGGGTYVITYGAFLDQLEAGNVAAVTVTETRVLGRFRTPVDGLTDFAATRVEPGLAAALARQGADVEGAHDQTWFTTLLSWVLPVLLLFGLWSAFFRRMAGGQGLGGLVGIGKSRARVYVERATGVTFADVAGIDEAKAELQEIVAFLNDRGRYGRLGARIPRGILLVGPPGTGKTLLARAIAGEAGVPFFSISGSEFVELFVGVGAARVRDLFEQARQAAPCIIFIDELDALGRARGAFGGFGGNDEKEQTLNQLLAELDGFDPAAGIVLLAATNRPEILDPALLRSGRFDRQIVLDRPDRTGRAQILAVHSRGITLDPAVQLDDIAGLTPGFTGADLAKLVNEAAIIATRRGAAQVGATDFSAAVERIVAGTERRTRLMDADERARIAYHEMGHALVAASLPGSDPVQKVTIIPRSVGALGFTLQRPTGDRFLITLPELKARMAVLIAGRAAEELVFGEASTGAADDLAKVTDIARECVTRYGMDAGIGPVVLEEKALRFLGDRQGDVAPRDHSDATAREVDLALRALVSEALARASAILARRRADLDAGARLLLEKESLTPDDFPALRPAAGEELRPVA